MSTVPDDEVPANLAADPAVPSGGRTATMLAGKILAFAAMPALGLISTVAVLPALSHNFGTEGWTGIALAQSVGAALAAVSSLHWAVSGANDIAAYPAHRAALVRYSLRQRLLALVPALPLAAAITLWLTPGERLASTLMAMAMTVACLSQSWLYTGLSDPGRLALYEGGPRLASTVAALGLLVLTPYLWIYPLVQLAGTLTSVALSLRFIRRMPGQVDILPRITTRGEVALATTAQVSNAGYAYLIGPMVQAIKPSLYPIFAAGDRISKTVLAGMTAVPAAFQGWVGAAPPDERRARARQASYVMATVALVAAVGTGALLPAVGRFLFADTVDLTPVAWLIGALTGVAFLGASLFLVGMVPLGEVRTTYQLLLVSSLFLPAVTLLGLLIGGIHGGYLGAVLGGAVLIGVQAVLIFGTPRGRRRRRREIEG